MKKTLIIMGSIGVIIGAAWFGWSRLGSAPDINIPFTSGTENATTTITQSESTSPAGQNTLQQEALRIVNRDIRIQVLLNPAVELEARTKIQELNGMIRANYDYDAQWLDLGAYRRMIGDYEGAKEAWEFLAKIRPQSFVVFHNLGDLYAYEFKNYSKAEENFLKSVANKPSNIQAYSQLVTVYRYLDTAQAAKIEPLLLKGIAANPEDANLRVLLAQHYEGQGRKEDALKYFKEAFRLDPKNTSLQTDIDRLTQ